MKKHLQFLLLCCAAVAGGCKNEASSGTDAEMDRFIDELMSRMTDIGLFFKGVYV